MNSIALKRWLVLGSLLGLTLYLAWNSPQSEKSSATLFKPNHEVATKSTQAPVNQSEPKSRAFHFAPRTQAVTEVVDIFAPAVVERPQVDFKPVVRQAIPAPQAPPLPFSFVGKITEADSVKFFLQADNVVYSVKVGDMLTQQYQLVAAENGKLSLRYLPLNITQTMLYGSAP